jgi:hypothetical protein
MDGRVSEQTHIFKHFWLCARKKRRSYKKKNAKHKTSSYNKNIATDSFTLFQTSPLDAK